MNGALPTSATSLPHTGRVGRALLSVYDKEGLVAFGRLLYALGVELLASGGTAKALTEAGVPVTPIEIFTGAPEALGGRVKTLHPKVHAGLLADRRSDDHLRQLAQHGYEPIDLVVCNLYPFEETLASGASPAEIIEQIDIGGPTLLRAAAKNVDGGVTVVTDPADYPLLLDELRAHGGISPALRRKLASRAFRRVADYDAAIAAWTAAWADEPQPLFPVRSPSLLRGQELRYGENPHQSAYLYLDEPRTPGVAGCQQLGGKPLSYNNYLDLDASYRAVYDLAGPACAIVKHTNPCGLAEASTQQRAFELALAADPLSAFGSVIGFNRPLDEETARAIFESKLFVECIVAPDFAPGARKLLGSRENLRLCQAPPGHPAPQVAGHRIGGGMLLQSVDRGPLADGTAGWQVVTRQGLQPGWKEELAFAMHVAWVLKSNSIAVTRDRCLLGAGGGLMSRVDAAELALKKAGERGRGAFLASDAFFPFPDCVQLAGKAGVVAIVQPGGSLRDSQSIAACDELGLAMVFTGQRHFRH